MSTNYAIGFCNFLPVIGNCVISEKVIVADGIVATLGRLIFWLCRTWTKLPRKIAKTRPPF